jgi:hypothetical protein
LLTFLWLLVAVVAASIPEVALVLVVIAQAQEHQEAVHLLKQL